jgi:3-isopropylmalate/(R)-2-methylmalate dehydratase large subunit
MGIKVTDRIPTKAELKDISEAPSFDKSLEYMGLQEGTQLLGKSVDYVFIGSCTNARIEDLRLVAEVVKGKKKAANVEVWVVPGSKQVEQQAKKEGLDQIFREAGFELREPGCSACLAMNEDKIPAGKYCISTSNRNFEGRQGPKSRTFLASPLSAAAAAITGKVTDVRELVK